MRWDYVLVCHAVIGMSLLVWGFNLTGLVSSLSELTLDETGSKQNKDKRSRR
jgi:hypothetical protein